jgi:hypothetical protein
MPPFCHLPSTPPLSAFNPAIVVAHIIAHVITHIIAHHHLPSNPTSIAQVIAHCHHHHSPPPPS